MAEHVELVTRLAMAGVTSASYPAGRPAHTSGRGRYRPYLVASTTRRAGWA